ncbi:hypothetical protein ACJRO7_019204 [Eucalyptus globulus]|uniref:RING-type E3 ubiquitin transferase n=1 Tax=Eucalyptus globulus TaxID=34317 RepID=A0ABD3KI62_EUCGL
MDPEFLVEGKLTIKSDVYFFRIILVELLTRRLTFGIAKSVRKAIREGTLEAILDPLAGKWPYMLAKELTHLALECCKMSRSKRPYLWSDRVIRCFNLSELPVDKPRRPNTWELSNIYVVYVYFELQVN